MDISVSNWTEVAVISKWLLLYYAFMQFLLFYFSWNTGMLTLILDQKKRETRYFSCLHWNVNSILAHNKLTLLEAYSTIHQYKILCISETIFRLFSFKWWHTTLTLPQVITLLSKIILAMLKGVVSVCIARKNYLWEWLISPSFLSVLCESNSSKTDKKVMWLLFIDLQAKQLLNLMSSYQILRSFLILLNSFNHLLL